MIHTKSLTDIAIMLHSGRVVAKILKEVEEALRPGIATSEIEKLVEEKSRAMGVVPAFKGYMGYPSCICVSINNEVVHGIPSDERIFEDGDIVGFDFGAYYKGFYTDAAVTLPVGEISGDARKLMKVTKESLFQGIRSATAGNRIGNISHSVQSYVEKNGYSVVKTFVGHGIGRSLHEEPQVPNFGGPNSGARLKEGMTLAIEPMVNEGTDAVNVQGDGWTAVTADGGLSAHFEHTIAITADGPVILTIDEEL